MKTFAGRTLQYGFVANVLFVLIFLLGLFLWVDPFQLFPRTSPLLQWLDACPENGVRFACNSTRVGHDRLYGHIDFQNDNLGLEADPGPDNQTTSTTGPRSIFSIPINPAQEVEIQHVINTMPEQKVPFYGSYDFDHNIYFSLWKDHQFQIYVYAKDAVPEQVSALLKSFRLNLNEAIR
jgi:hypothetical protein